MEAWFGDYGDGGHGGSVKLIAPDPEPALFEAVPTAIWLDPARWDEIDDPHQQMFWMKGYKQPTVWRDAKIGKITPLTPYDPTLLDTGFE